MGHKKLTDNNHQHEWPAYLQNAATAKKIDALAEKPVIIDMSRPRAEKQLAELIAKNDILDVVDNYDEQLAELLLSKDAHLYRANESIQQNSIKEHLEEHYQKTPAWKKGTWVFFPWNGKLLHLISKDLFSDLRTIRNRDLITKEEQHKLASFNVVCLGMSVGSSSALALILSGISDRIKIADGAVISGSNLNRILTGVDSIGKSKTLTFKQKLYEMNPYIDVFDLKEKVTKKNLSEFFDRRWKTDLIIDEIDDLEMKILVRVEARKRKIPVIMATELADNIMLDVERFDLNSAAPLFHGLIPNLEEVLNKKDMSQREWMKYATTIIGPKNVPLIMQESLLKIGSKVVTHPQLGATAMMTGGVLAFAVKQIALGQDLPSMRKTISLEREFLKGHRTFSHRRKHAKHTKILERSMRSM